MSNARNIASIAGEDVLNASNEIVPVYACRAWVNFNGTLDEDQLSLTTGENVYIRDDGNVSSVSYISEGRYGIAFSQNMPHTDYAVSGITQRSENYSANINVIVMAIRAEPNAGLSNSGFEITTHFQTNAAQTDPVVVCISVFC